MRITTANDPAAEEGQRRAAAADEPREMESGFERELRVNGWAEVDTFHCADCGHAVPIVAIEGREGLFRARHTTAGGLTGGGCDRLRPRWRRMREQRGRMRRRRQRLDTGKSALVTGTRAAIAMDEYEVVTVAVGAAGRARSRGAHLAQGNMAIDPTSSTRPPAAVDKKRPPKLVMIQRCRPVAIFSRYDFHAGVVK